MKDNYTLPNLRVSADLLAVKTPKRYILTRLEVGQEIRTKGYAGKLLNLVLSDADKEQATILLSVVPDGTGLGFYQLTLFYMRRGFEFMNDSEINMIRKPNVR